MKRIPPKRAWFTTLSWLWHSLSSKNICKNTDNEDLLWMDPIATTWRSTSPSVNKKSPSLTPKDDFLTRLTALYNALQDFAPQNREVTRLQKQLKKIKKDIDRIEQHQYEFRQSVQLDTYQLLVDEQTEFLSDVQHCREEVKKIKKSLPEEWINAMSDYFNLFETKPNLIHKKEIN